MPTGLKRYQLTGDLHFITFSCYHRRPYLAEPGAYTTFERTLEETRRYFGFFVAGYVLMPEHVHLLLSEPPGVVLATSLKRLKWTTSRRLKGNTRDHFWQARDYDFNVYSQHKLEEKLDDSAKQRHAPQPGKARSGQQAGRLATQQRPPPPNRSHRHRRNSILVDRPTPKT